MYRLAYGIAVLVLAGITWKASADNNDISGIWIDANGNVGVGTKQPESNLHVKGNLKADGTVTGQGYQGRYGSSANIAGFNTLGKAATFLFSFDEANFGRTPKAIQIFNPESNVYKTFIINHPLNSDQYLVHATLEGPEGAVFYRGTTQLLNGKAIVTLPDYFEALTQKQSVTVLLTNIDGFDRLAVKTRYGEKITNGEFLVISDNKESHQRFDWEVKATRKDKPDLIVEPNKKDITVEGFGPYRYGK